ncbi:hypothetical protein EXIGLDRAFT_733447 [Exidia glandulosa HHB12029]|uniref:Uncharacterized protein n=1 Tax=Exidia glandulosa HHB12029 TaxID=1314781 RepID=A0A165BAI9_EXIGL|nr:hypothetical protein EXIGLDRAFT_733447 [Exidia glandulosa HHB12029]
MHEHETFWKLVPRYSRSPHGVVILYGAKNPAVLHCTTFEDMEKQLVRMIEIYNLKRAGLKCSRGQMLILLLHAQVQHINFLWRTVIAQSRGVVGGYCTSAIDVHLCDALDTFSALEDAMVDSKEFAYSRSTGFQDGGCTCRTCAPDSEELVRMWLFGAVNYAYLPRPLFKRVFGDFSEALAPTRS